jgi:hypothetical protein
LDSPQFAPFASPELSKQAPGCIALWRAQGGINLKVPDVLHSSRQTLGMRKVLPLRTPMSGYRIDQLVQNLVVAELKVVSSSSASLRPPR